MYVYQSKAVSLLCWSCLSAKRGNKYLEKDEYYLQGKDFCKYIKQPDEGL